MHDGAEDHRCNHHLDQGDKAVAERFQLFAEIGIEISDRNAQPDRDQDLYIEDLVPGVMMDGGSGCLSGHGALANEKNLGPPSWHNAAGKSHLCRLSLPRGYRKRSVPP